MKTRHFMMAVAIAASMVIQLQTVLRGPTGRKYDWMDLAADGVTAVVTALLAIAYRPGDRQ